MGVSLLSDKTSKKTFSCNSIWSVFLLFFILHPADESSKPLFHRGKQFNFIRYDMKIACY